MSTKNNPQRVRRYITEFSEETDELLAEYDLHYFDLARFQVEFNEQDSNDPMYDCYPITEHNIDFLEQYLVTIPKWDFKNRAYFVEAHSLED